MTCIAPCMDTASVRHMQEDPSGWFPNEGPCEGPFDEGTVLAGAIDPVFAPLKANAST